MTSSYPVLFERENWFVATSSVMNVQWVIVIEYSFFLIHVKNNQLIERTNEWEVDNEQIFNRTTKYKVSENTIFSIIMLEIGLRVVNITLIDSI